LDDLNVGDIIKEAADIPEAWPILGFSYVILDTDYKSI